MAALPVLERDCGPSGVMRYGTRTVEIAGWEIFEGEDIDNPNMCRGWFRCPDARFSPLSQVPIRLQLRLADGTERIVDATVIDATDDPAVWEFRGNR
jgi:hypothetical protein